MRGFLVTLRRFSVVLPDVRKMLRALPRDVRVSKELYFSKK